MHFFFLCFKEDVLVVVDTLSKLDGKPNNTRCTKACLSLYCLVHNCPLLLLVPPEVIYSIRPNVQLTIN